MFNIMKNLLVLSFTLSLLKEESCEIFSAIDELEVLVQIENQILNHLSCLAHTLNDSYVNRKLDAWQKDHDLLQQDVTHYITNPLNAFLMIKRTYTDFHQIRKRFPEHLEDFYQDIKSFLPTYEDLTGAVEGLLRLQFIYKLKSFDFANGVIDGKVTRKPLSPHDLFVLGTEALKLEGQLYFADEYMRLSWECVKIGVDVDNEVNEDCLLLNLVRGQKLSGDFEGAIKTMDYFINKHPEFPENAAIRSILKASHEEHGTTAIVRVDPYNEYFVPDGIFSAVKENIIYSQVCRGNLTKSIQELSQLHCKYVSNSPFSKLARFKMEEANLEPYIVLFIDVLSDDEIKFIQEKSKPKVERAQTLGADNQNQKSSQRVSKFTWFYDHEYELIKKITLRVEDMSGLTHTTMEATQVQNYGIGGHYVPHWDHFLKNAVPFDSAGNRIATCLFYLTDVEKEGATIFPYLKLRLLPRKGAAAFWHNLKRSGDSEYAVRHAACPVLLGRKWVVNKWIREHGNEFRRPCLPENFVEESENQYFRGFI